MARSVAAGPKSPAFTIVIPVYNNGATLMAALDSVRHQTMPNWEVILWDDGSTDPETVALLDSLDLPTSGSSGRPTRGSCGPATPPWRGLRGSSRSSSTRTTRSSRPTLRRRSSPSRRNPDADVVVPMTRVKMETGELLWQPPPFDEVTVSYENIAPIATAFRTRVWDLVGGMAQELDAGFEDWGFWTGPRSAGLPGRGSARAAIPVLALAELRNETQPPGPSVTSWNYASSRCSRRSVIRSRGVAAVSHCTVHLRTRCCTSQRVEGGHWSSSSPGSCEAAGQRTSCSR